MAVAKEFLGLSLVERPSFVPASGFLFNHQFKRRLHPRIDTSLSMPTARLGLEMLLGRRPDPCSHCYYSPSRKFYPQLYRPQGQQKGLSALADDQKNMEKLQYEQVRAEYGSSTRSQDGNAGLSKAVGTFIQFTRPYASFGSIVGIISASLFPVEAIGDLSPKFFLGVLQAAIAAMLMKTFVSGINHLYDVEIDKINKQHFPLASGEYSTETAWAITCAAALLSFGIGFMSQSPALLCGLLMCFIFGSVYSVDLPFLRWKKNPVLAAVCLMFIDMFSVYIPSFIHAQRYLLGRSIVITKPVILTTVIMCVHSIAIFIFKDIPDTEGDKENGIQTFSTEHGRQKALFVGVNVLLIEYAIAIIVGASTASTLFSKFASVIGHCLLALALWFRSRSVDVMNNSAAFSFYMFIWQLFYFGNVLLLLYR
ncbi:probable homogentisate phytyltransferase 1, chloroplastic isoform X2 [Telopea speciosissima]|uniref:probable homogentisate phytyltransferase 1, chloroplastic isoform X2 n=1 Tax=Telopea speciosissima TaxID=54955 RepID=UPI001CC745CD|nr:probable homogentisate phytyltransferase 1, chloroplastic isoform X2 [Telopea speciosissima]